MNREIVFRGKRLDNGGWIYGDIRQYSENHTGICCHRLNRTFSVDPATVGQFTGLFDKYSAKIWEDDIVEMQLPKSKPIRCTVEFQNGSFGLKYRHLGAVRFTPFTGICNAEFEVVGELGSFEQKIAEGFLVLGDRQFKNEAAKRWDETLREIGITVQEEMGDVECE